MTFLRLTRHSLTQTEFGFDTNKAYFGTFKGLVQHKQSLNLTQTKKLRITNYELEEKKLRINN